MEQHSHYDIAIIGSGITGLSTAYHLAKMGPLRVCISGDSDSTTQASANMIAGGLIDNFTRIAQRHGPEKAQAAWAYSDHAYDAVVEFAKSQNLALHLGARVRLIETQDEWVECKKAVEQLNHAGFVSVMAPAPKESQNLLGQQVDQPRAAYLAAKDLTQRLMELTSGLDRVGHTLTVQRDRTGHRITTREKTFTADVVVYANHLAIADFLPGLKEVLIGSQDQWLRLRTQGGKGEIPFPVGSLLTWRHGHYWAHVESPTQLTLGGARFLRPLAGFEADHAEMSEKVTQNLPLAWAKYFPTLALTETVDSRAVLDIRPCDELPVIGPMFGETGIFLAAGYMGQGLSLGFKAGQSLANVVMGKKDELPRFFWPERHRSLENNDEES